MMSPVGESRACERLILLEVCTGIVSASLVALLVARVPSSPGERTCCLLCKIRAVGL